MGKLLSETTIKLDTELLRMATGVAQAEGITRSEYIRDLITVDIKARRRKHTAMITVFGQINSIHHELSGVTELHNETDNEHEHDHE